MSGWKRASIRNRKKQLTQKEKMDRDKTFKRYVVWFFCVPYALFVVAVLGAVDLLCWILQQFFLVLYKAEVLIDSSSTYKADNAVENHQKRCPKGSSQCFFLFVDGHLLRMLSGITLASIKKHLQRTKLNHKRSTAPNICKFFREKQTGDFWVSRGEVPINERELVKLTITYPE